MALAVQPLYAFTVSRVVSAAQNIHTTNLNTWNLNDSKSKGHNEIVANGLHVWTEEATDDGKAAGYYATPNLKLKDVSSASIDFATYSGVRPGLQLAIDRDNDSKWDGYLVYEPWAYGEGNWWTNKTGFGVQDGSGYTSMGTLAQYQAANPNANVLAIGYSLGSGKKGDAVITKMTFGSTSYTFGLAPLSTPTNLKPANNAATNNSGFTMSWNAVAGATKYEYRTSDTMVNATTLGNLIYEDASATSSNYQFTPSTITRLNFGTPANDYYWQVRAGNDAQWSEWSAISKVTVEYTAPTVLVTANGQALASSTPADPMQLLPAKQTAFQAQVADEKSGAYGAYIELFKANANGSYGTWVTDNTKAEGSVRFGEKPTLMVDTSTLNGKYGLKIDASDKAGNKTTKYVFFTVDNTIPTITVKNQSTSTTDGTLGSNPYAHVSFKLNDKGGNLKEVLINGNSYPRVGEWNDLNWVNITKSHLNQGSNVAIVRDTAGNESQLSFMYDSVAPSAPTLSLKTLQGTSLVSNGFTNKSDVVAQWSNEASDIVSYEYAYWNNIENNQYNSEAKAWKTTVTGRERAGSFTEGEGTHYIKVRSTDAAGNVSAWSNTFAVVYDKTRPAEFSLVTSNGENASGALVSGVESFTFTQSEKNPKSIYIEYMEKDAAGIWRKKSGKEALNTNNVTLTVDTAKWNDGDHQIKVTSKDDAGNSLSQTFGFTIDNTAPVATVTSIEYNDETNSLELQGTAESEQDSIFIVYGEDLYQAEVMSDKTWSAIIPVAAGTLGEQTITVFASDEAGNTSMPGISRTVTISAPVIPTAPTIVPQSSATQQQNAFVAPARTVATTPFAQSLLGQSSTADETQIAQSSETPQVLGAETSRTGSAASTDKAAVAGVSTTNTSSFNLWWIVAALAVIAAAWWAIAAYRRKRAES
jgi:hypothetical protein